MLSWSVEGPHLQGNLLTRFLVLLLCSFCLRSRYIFHEMTRGNLVLFRFDSGCFLFFFTYARVCRNKTPVDNTRAVSFRVVSSLRLGFCHFSPYSPPVRVLTTEPAGQGGELLYGTDKSLIQSSESPTHDPSESSKLALSSWLSVSTGRQCGEVLLGGKLVIPSRRMCKHPGERVSTRTKTKE